jgi:hypothetical protein
MQLVKEQIEEIKSLDVEKIDFDDKKAAKELILKLLSIIES